MRELVLIAHDIRSTHNVGSLFRTAEGLGVQKFYLTGYTPYPQAADDGRLPHLAAKIGRQIDKTALGAAASLPWEHAADPATVLQQLRQTGFTVAALEQTPGSVSLPGYVPPAKLAIIVGNEVDGVDPTLLKLADAVLEIPMSGRKESFNVVQAAAMALYHCRFTGSNATMGQIRQR